MQQPIHRADLYEREATVVVNGDEVEIERVKVERGMRDPLNSRNLRAASANVTAHQGKDVTETVPTPWDPGSAWPPPLESPATVAMDSGGGPVSALANGRVISSSGGTGTRAAQFEVSDAYQTLERPISWNGLGSAMPALTEATTQRYVSLRATAVTDMVLRHCGWNATPPMLGFCITSVPAMGTMWPERGTLLTSGRSGSSGYPPMFTEEWGVAVGDVLATYQRAAAYSIKGRGTMEMTAVAGSLEGESKSLMARTDTFRWARLAWSDTIASVTVVNGAGAAVVAASLPRARGSFLYASLEYVSDTSLRVTLRVDDASTSSVVPVHSDLATQHLTVVEVSGAARGGGFQVSFPSTVGSLVGWTPNAVIYDRGSGYNALEALPPVAGRNCADLLAEQCEAQNSTYWIDETGVLRWWDLERLEARDNVATLTDAADITAEGFTWDHSVSSVRRSVTVQWREPLAEGGWRTDVDLWQGSGQTLGVTTSNNGAEDWIKVPADEVWIMPDLSLARIGDSGQMDDFNYGWGSHYGGVVRRSDGAEEWAQTNGSLLMTIERVNDSSFKYQKVWTGPGQAIERTPSGGESDGLWGIRRNFDLPIIRGKKKYTFGDMSYTAAQTGPDTAPDHVIDAGWWIQNETQAQRTADYAAARLTVPNPVLSSVDLVLAPGLQLGDMVTVVDNTRTRLTIRGTIVEDIRELRANGAASHAIAVRPVSVSRNGVTWQEWAKFIAPSTWSQWATAEGGTWAQWGSNPLNE